ncbi:TetR/AcrR family transcriptional regulator [Jatrophihabitans sp.]|uniref:TetR/AcrR family transcriptional regulator n=1 Tax=Jatrophihabitans sp. TaxID=1932789 RepID=UPI0030C70DF2|nr:putative TetR family transcriptional regulator [Jatrophihabitans sp.]
MAARLNEKRTRLDPIARRAQLIALGVEMLATRTLDALSVEDIAQKAGISRGLLFHYFSSKQEFHVEVARAAAAELLTRTEPDVSLPPLEALRSSLTEFVDYVEENPDSYKSLVRGAASGDADMRAIFDDTRATMAGRIVAVLADLGLPLGPRAELAVHGWVAFAEECVIRSIDGGVKDREGLLEMLTKALPAVVIAASDEGLNSLITILTSDASLAAK